ncbi:MAG: hypothetical protein HKP16_06670 [Xanthomonadales bacterium]|nr:hypothetical protein [Xanthomonadales bacterium]
MHRWRIVSLLLFFFITPLHAEYQAGLDAYRAGDYATAMAEWKEAVKEEPERENLALYRESLYAIAMLYWQGEGVEQDYGISAVWLKQAADINHPGAQTKLGYLYVSGQGVPQNYSEAVKWFQLAANQGDRDARLNLDIMYNRRMIPPPDEAQDPVSAQDQVSAKEPDEAQDPEPRPAGDRGEDWILEQDPEHYTIQVIALRSKEKLLDFMDRHAQWAPFAIYGQTRYQQPLGVMVQGVYPDVETARAARDEFPPGLQAREDLWIRRFERVQRLIE